MNKDDAVWVKSMAFGMSSIPPSATALVAHLRYENLEKDAEIERLSAELERYRRIATEQKRRIADAEADMDFVLSQASQGMHGDSDILPARVAPNAEHEELLVAENRFRELYVGENDKNGCEFDCRDGDDGHPVVLIGNLVFNRRHLCVDASGGYLLLFTADFEFRVQFPLFACKRLAVSVEQSCCAPFLQRIMAMERCRSASFILESDADELWTLKSTHYVKK
jgi:hypothetical protein